MKLNLDGVEIAELDPRTGKLIGGMIPAKPLEEKREQMTVPLVREELPPNEEEETGETSVASEEGEEESVDFEKLPPSLQKFLQDQIDSNQELRLQLGELASKLESATRSETEDNLDLIKEINPENDPFGVAATLRNVAKAVKDIGARVSRLDQHTGYVEATKQVETAKSAHKDVFEDKKLGPIANRLLTAELATNRRDSLPVIVRNVAKEVSRLSTSATKEYVKDKVERTSKLPASTLREGEGMSAAVTVNRPKNVEESSKAYAAWRKANAKFNKEGR